MSGAELQNCRAGSGGCGAARGRAIPVSKLELLPEGRWQREELLCACPGQELGQQSPNWADNPTHPKALSPDEERGREQLIPSWILLLTGDLSSFQQQELGAASDCSAF